MTKIHELQSERAKVADFLRSLNEGAKDRDFTAGEKSDWDSKITQMRNIDERIARETQALTLLAAAVQNADPFTKNEKKELSKYSFVRAINAQLRGGKLDGIEGEMHQLAVEESRNIGGVNIGGFGLPSAMLKIRKDAQKRDMTTSGTAGGYSIATEIGELVPFLYPRLKSIDLGATVFSGLVGNLDLPVNDAVGTAGWETENSAADEVSPTLARRQLTPKRLAATTDISKGLLNQSTLDVEAYVRGNLEKIIAVALDLVAIKGGGSNEPTGIIATSGIGDVAGGTNGANPTWANIVALESDVATANADMGKMGYLTTPGVRGYLKSNEKTSGNGAYIWNMPNELNGYRAEASTQVPSTLTKGSSSGICHAIVFGNWEELVVAQWGGLDIVVDPYSKKTTSLVEVTVNSWWDIALKHPASFSAMLDALV